MQEMEHRVLNTMSNENDFDYKVGKITLHLTNQKKIYFPDDGITKGDIVNYYNEIAEIILPYLKNRPTVTQPVSEWNKWTQLFPERF